MSEEKVKRELSEAIKGAVKLLDNPKGSCEIIILDGKVFHIEAIRDKEVRKIRITIDEIKDGDREKVRNLGLPSIIFTKEIWCKKEGRLKFEIEKI